MTEYVAVSTGDNAAATVKAARDSTAASLRTCAEMPEVPRYKLISETVINAVVNNVATEGDVADLRGHVKSTFNIELLKGTQEAALAALLAGRNKDINATLWNTIIAFEAFEEYHDPNHGRTIVNSTPQLYVDLLEVCKAEAALYEHAGLLEAMYEGVQKCGGQDAAGREHGTSTAKGAEAISQLHSQLGGGRVNQAWQHEGIYAIRRLEVEEGGQD